MRILVAVDFGKHNKYQRSELAAVVAHDFLDHRNNLFRSCLCRHLERKFHQAMIPLNKVTN